MQYQRSTNDNFPSPLTWGLAAIDVAVAADRATPGAGVPGRLKRGARYLEEIRQAATRTLNLWVQTATATLVPTLLKRRTP